MRIVTGCPFCNGDLIILDYSRDRLNRRCISCHTSFYGQHLTKEKQIEQALEYERDTVKLINSNNHRPAEQKSFLNLMQSNYFIQNFWLISLAYLLVLLLILRGKV